MRSHGSEVANAWSAARFLGEPSHLGKTLFCGLPMFHVNAMMVTGLVPFSRGVARGGRHAAGLPCGGAGLNILGTLSSILGSPAFHRRAHALRALCCRCPPSKHDLSPSLEYGICGAAPLPMEIIRGFEAKTGIKILEGYGLTEGACISTVNPPAGETRSGSIGIRLPGQQAKIVILDDDGAYVRVGRSGRSWHHRHLRRQCLRGLSDPGAE